MMDLSSWLNVLLFPACVLAAAMIVTLIQLRAEAKWRAEARSQRVHTPAE